MSSNPDEPQRIFWDASVNNFRDFDSGSIVSRLLGIEHLHPTIQNGVERFRDDLGRLVPALLDLIPQSLRTDYINRITDSRQANFDVFSKRAPSGAFFSTLVTYLNADGTLGVVLFNSAGSVPINPELENRKTIANILTQSEKDGFDMSYEEAVSAALAVAHYVTR